MNNLSLRAKLSLSFVFVIVLLLCIGDTGFYSQAQMNVPAENPKTEQGILVALTDIEINIYKMQVAALNGMYRKDVRVAAPGKITYRQYMSERVNSVAMDTAELLKKVSENYKKARKEDSVKLCEDTAKLLEVYADQACVWAVLQDEIHDSAKRRNDFVDAARKHVKNIVNRVIEIAVRVKQKIDAPQADGTVIKDVEFTEFRRLMQLKDLGEILEGIEFARRLSRELVTITDPGIMKMKNEEIKMAFDQTTKQLEGLVAEFKTAANQVDAQAAADAFRKWEEEMNRIIKKMEEQEALTRKMGEIADNVTENVIKLRELQ